MLNYVLRRLGQSALTVLLVTLIIFVIVRLVGDPTHLMLPPEATEADRQLLREQMGLDRPVILQYGMYLVDLAQGKASCCCKQCSVGQTCKPAPGSNK